MVSTRPRVFVDTNVLFSALHSKNGVPARILEMHLGGQIELVVSVDVLEELAREVSANVPAALPALSFFLRACPPDIIGDPTADGLATALRQVNPGDAAIWAAALASGADYLVTGDRRFLREGRAAQSAIAVLTPRELVDEIERSPQGGGRL